MKKVRMTIKQFERLQKIANEYWNMHVHAYYQMAKYKDQYNALKDTTKADISWIEDNVKKYKLLSDVYMEKCMNIRGVDCYPI